MGSEGSNKMADLESLTNENVPLPHKKNILSKYIKKFIKLCLFVCCFFLVYKTSFESTNNVEVNKSQYFLMLYSTITPIFLPFFFFFFVILNDFSSKWLIKRFLQ